MTYDLGTTLHFYRATRGNIPDSVQDLAEFCFDFLKSKQKKLLVQIGSKSSYDREMLPVSAHSVSQRDRVRCFMHVHSIYDCKIHLYLLLVHHNRLNSLRNIHQNCRATWLMIHRNMEGFAVAKIYALLGRIVQPIFHWCSSIMSYQTR